MLREKGFIACDKLRATNTTKRFCDNIHGQVLQFFEPDAAFAHIKLLAYFFKGGPDPIVKLRIVVSRA